MKKYQPLVLIVATLLVVTPQTTIAQTVEQLIQQGDAAERQGKHAQAEAIWRRVLQRDPKQAYLYGSLGDSLKAQGKINEAIAAYRKNIQLAPDELLTGRAYYGLTNILRSQDKQAEVLPLCRQAIHLQATGGYACLLDLLSTQPLTQEEQAAYQTVKQNPREAKAAFDLATALRQQNKRDEASVASQYAIEVCLYTLRQNRSNPRVFAILDAGLRAENNPKQMLWVYNVLMQLQPRNAAAFVGFGDAFVATVVNDYKQEANRQQLRLGDVLKEQKRLGYAMAEYRIALQVDPGKTYRYLTTGETLADLPNVPAAIAARQKIVLLGSGDRERYMRRVRFVVFISSRLETAIERYRKATELDSNHAMAHVRFADALYEQEKLREIGWAEDMFNQYLRLAFANDAQLQRGMQQVKKIQQQQEVERQKLNQVVAAYRKALQLDPTNAVVYNSLGNVLYDQRKLDEAVAAYRNAIKLAPENADSYINLGIALHRQKQLKDAIDSYRKAIELNPNHAEAFNLLGNALQDQKNLDAAITAYRQAIALDATNPIYYSFLASALAEQQQWDAAIAAYRQAMQQERPEARESFNPFFHLGLMYIFQQQGGQQNLNQALSESQYAERLGGGGGTIGFDKVRENEQRLQTELQRSP